MPTFHDIFTKTLPISVIASLIAIILAWVVRFRALKERHESQRYENSAIETPSSSTKDKEKAQEQYYHYASALFLLPAIATSVSLYIKILQFSDKESISIVSASTGVWSPVLILLAQAFLLYLPALLSGLVIAKLFWPVLKPLPKSRNLQFELISNIFINPLIFLGYLGFVEIGIQSIQALAWLLNHYPNPKEKDFLFIDDPFVAIALLGMSGGVFAVHSLATHVLEIHPAFPRAERVWHGPASEYLFALARSMKAERCRVIVTPSSDQKKRH